MFDFDTPREAKRFRVKHPNGYIEINVGTFFGTSPQKKVNKLLRLARKYCTEDQRKELLCNIVEEAKYRSDILDELDSLISKGRMLFYAIFGRQWPTGVTSRSCRAAACSSAPPTPPRSCGTAQETAGSGR